MTTELTKAAQQALEACPFCGSTNIKVHSYSDAVIGGEPDAFAQCHDCSVTGPNGKTEADAAESWNTRALTQRPAAPTLKGFTPPTAEWLAERLAISDDFDASAGAPCSKPPGCNGSNCLGCGERPAPQQAAPAQYAGALHLFEFWWEAHMPQATQAQAWKAWTDAQDSKGAAIEAPQQATPEQPSHTLICSKCKVDRLKAPCPNLSNCGMGFAAQGDNLLMKRSEREALSPSALSLLQSCAASASATQQATPDVPETDFGNMATQQATHEPVKFSHAGHFYNLVAHALMEVKRPDACAHRLRLILDELAVLMGQPATPTQQAAGEPVAVTNERELALLQNVGGSGTMFPPDTAGFHVKLYTHPAPGVPEDVRTALEFYAGGNHFVRADADAWETVSGEPPNFWEDEANTATVEDGAIARNALAALAAAQAKGGVQ